MANKSTGKQLEITIDLQGSMFYTNNLVSFIFNNSAILFVVLLGIQITFSSLYETEEPEEEITPTPFDNWILFVCNKS